VSLFHFLAKCLGKSTPNCWRICE